MITVQLIRMLKLAGLQRVITTKRGNKVVVPWDWVS
jgi:hypothetical protein